MDYPWTVLRVGRSQDEGGPDLTGPWMVAWQWSIRGSILVMSERLLKNMAGPDRAAMPPANEVGHAIGLHMDAQQERPFWFKRHDAAVRIRDDVRRRVKNDHRYSPEFDCRACTKQELDQWRIEAELRQIASQEGTGP